MSLRILHVLQPAETDAGRSIEDVCGLSVLQKEFGHSVEFLTIGKARSARLEELGAPIHKVRGRWGRYGYSPEMVRWIRGNAARFHCIVVHGVWDFCGLGTWLALRKAGIPYFIIPHGTLDPWFKLSHPVRHMLRWLYWLWGGYPILRDAHAVFFLCEEERQRARQAFWLYDCHEFVVRPGSWELETAVRGGSARAFLEAYPSLRGKKLVALVADPDSLDGLRTVAGSVALLRERGSWDGTTTQLLVLDPTRGGARAAVDAIVRDRGLSGCVTAIYGQSSSEISDALAASAALIRPADFEICSRRPALALACGTPVISSTGVMHWREIADEAAGLVAENSASGYARMLAAMLASSDEEAAVMRTSARRCFEGNFAPAAAAHSLSSAIYLFVGIHRDARWNSRPLRPASELQ
ncbi:MAG TPA: glycosyltransferase [Opitutaceae bacterium]|jgi:glycosyltransferase involved in cell wall biosynthesis